MTQYIAFLRGINVGGNTKVPMKDLSVLCTDIGFKEVRTYINSGNVLFISPLDEVKVSAKLDKALCQMFDRNIDVVIRTDAELKKILTKNPFPKAIPAQVGVLLMADAVAKDALTGMVNDGPEEVKVSGREIYIHYPLGMGRTKLKLPATIGKFGTVRNINTITKLIGML